MSWRTIVVSNSSKIDYQMGFLSVRGKETIKVHMSEIGTLIVETTAVSITAAAMSELINNKVKVIFCDEKRNPAFELSPFYGAYNTSQKVRLQSEWNTDKKAEFWTAIIAEKIHKQSQLLAHYDRKESEQLLYYIDQLELGDVTNREGFAAKVYFNALFGMDFKRERPDALNAALNYGYTILLSAVSRRIVSCGYITQIGLFHDNVHNRFNLSSDLMEPFRPIVDRTVKELMPEMFGKNEKLEMLKVFDKKVIIAGREETVNNAISIYIKSVFSAMENDDVMLIKFYSYEF